MFKQDGSETEVAFDVKKSQMPFIEGYGIEVCSTPTVLTVKWVLCFYIKFITIIVKHLKLYKHVARSY